MALLIIGRVPVLIGRDNFQWLSALSISTVANIHGTISMAATILHPIILFSRVQISPSDPMAFNVLTFCRSTHVLLTNLSSGHETHLVVITTWDRVEKTDP